MAPKLKPVAAGFESSFLADSKLKPVLGFSSDLAGEPKLKPLAAGLGSGFLSSGLAFSPKLNPVEAGFLS